MKILRRQKPKISSKCRPAHLEIEKFWIIGPINFPDTPLHQPIFQIFELIFFRANYTVPKGL